MLRRITLLVLGLTLVACGGATSTPTAVRPTSVSFAPLMQAGQPLRDVTIAMSYTPNVQFAPYYVAAAKGYYKQAGLNVQFDYNFENDVVQRAAAWPESKVEFATAGGISVLLARQQGLPIKAAMTLYQDFPVVFFSKGAVKLDAVQDLKGKSIGIPGRFGESYYGLLAAMKAGNFQESDLDVREIGFTQAQAVLEDQVQIGVGYATNEPVLLQQQGQQVNVLRVADLLPLASNGTVVSDQLITQEPELVRGFMLATLRGVQDTLDNPDEAFEISLKQIPEAQLGDPQLQRQVLQATLPYFASDLTKANGLGYTDLAQWQQTAQFLLDSGLLPAPVNVEDAFTNDFITPKP